jgi:hypothetical protein
MKALILICLTLFIFQPCQALYRCNGRVQQYPCESPVRVVRGFGSHYMPKPRRPVNSQRPYAKILLSEFEFLPQSEGIWRGRVTGNGTVHLHLQIKKNGKVESTRYMGNVALAGKSTTFAFRSVTPPGANWSWDIVASNG